MAMTINTNVASLNAQRNLNTSQSALQTSLQRLSSGLRVNSAKDDAAGLAISERMSAQVRGMNVATRNANDGISLAQTAEGALAEITNALQRVRELAVQSANGVYSDDDRGFMQAESNQLVEEINRIVSSSQFNGTLLLDGTLGDTAIQAGPNSGTNNEITIAAITDQTVADIDISTATAAKTAITDIDTTLDTVNSLRADLGAIQSRLGTAIATLALSGENVTAAKGRIVDADFASETAALSRAQILQQAGTAMLAQANQLPQQVLKLLQ